VQIFRAIVQVGNFLVCWNFGLKVGQNRCPAAHLRLQSPESFSVLLKLSMPFTYMNILRRSPLTAGPDPSETSGHASSGAAAARAPPPAPVDFSQFVSARASANARLNHTAASGKFLLRLALMYESKSDTCVIRSCIVRLCHKWSV